MARGPVSRSLQLWPAAVGLIFLLLSASFAVSTVPGATMAQAPGPMSGPALLLATAAGPGPVPAANPVCAGEYNVDLTTNDSSVDTNSGLRMNVTGFIGGSIPRNSSFQVSVEETIGSYQAVFGLFENSQVTLTPFYAIYPVTSITPLVLEYWKSSFIIPGVGYDFQLEVTNGTVWSLSMNGVPFGNNLTQAAFDFGVPNVTAGANLRFAELSFAPGASFLPGSFVVPLAFAVFHSGAWYLPTRGVVSVCGNPNAWGLAGRLQSPPLAPGELVSGTQVAPVPNGTVAWLGGPVPVRVGVTVNPPQLAGLSFASVSASVTSTSGGGIPGVFLSAHDALGGVLAPSVGMTNGSGSSQFLLATPNVTANGSDLVTVTVTLFGYVGFAGTSVSLTPAVQILVSADTPSVTVAPGGTVGIGFTIRDTLGRTLPNVVIDFSVDAGVNVVPGAALSDTTGRVSTVVDAPGYSTVFQVRASIGSGGAWGSGTVQVHVLAPTVPWWSYWGAQIFASALVVTVGALVAWFLFIRGGPRRRIPELSLRGKASEPSAATEERSPQP